MRSAPHSCVSDPSDRPHHSVGGYQVVADRESLNLRLAAIGEDQRAGAVARGIVLGDESTAAGRGIQVEELTGKVLTGIEMKIVLVAALGNLQHITGE